VVTATWSVFLRCAIVPAILTQHSYGKSQIRVTKVTRLPDRHEVRELTIEIQLEGDFARSYTGGDNRLIIPTDTMKNVAYALAKEHPLESIEDFGGAVANHFLEHHRHVERATIQIVEQPLERIEVDGHAHPHAFCGVRHETRTSTVRGWRCGLRVESGIDELFLLKSSGSAFTGFLRDRYTTLPDATDRILATILKADWLYATAPTDWNQARSRIRQTLLETFAGHDSLSAQQTLYAMGAAALEACPPIDRITLTMPNKHRILVDLRPFGLENANEVFLATDEPHGTITGTLQRA
jgi:urate oxidase